MPTNAREIYWDSCVFIHYIEGTPLWLPVIEAILDEAEKGEVVIYTSTASMTEVAFSEAEKNAKTLDPEILNSIEALWQDPNIIKLVEYSPVIARRSREIIRASMIAGSTIKPMDAVHLASAQNRSVTEFHTMDDPLKTKCLAIASALGFAVKDPETMQPRLFSGSGPSAT